MGIFIWKADKRLKFVSLFLLCFLLSTPANVALNLFPWVSEAYAKFQGIIWKQMVYWDLWGFLKDFYF